jgi:Mrp family chromosome partitioning ATPase
LAAAAAADYGLTLSDVGAVLADPAAAELAAACGRVLLVARAGRTAGESLANAQRLLARAGAKLIGVVVNDPGGEWDGDEA